MQIFNNAKSHLLQITPQSNCKFFTLSITIYCDYSYICRVMTRPKIAIISANSLMNLGLKAIVERLMPMGEVCLFSSAEDVLSQPDDSFAHFFVSTQVFADNSRYFLERNRKVVVLTTSPQTILPANLHTLNVSQGEEEMVRDILRLHSSGHPHNHNPHSESNDECTAVLSEREKEVLALLVKGFINKEIAEGLNISINTVISHRRNIVERLGLRSVSALTIYAVTHGIVDIEEI